MPYSKDTPYTILGISPSANNQEIKKARDKAMRLRAYPIQKVMQAYNDLHNPRKRVEVDLVTITDLGEETELEQFLSHVPERNYFDEKITGFLNHPGLLRQAKLDPETNFLDIPANPFTLDGYEPETDLSSLVISLPIPD